MFFFVWYMYAVHMFLSWWWFRPIDKLVITESCRRTCSAADQGERVRGRTPSPFSGNLIWKTNKQTFNAHLKASFTIYNLHTIIIANKCFKNRAVTEFRTTDWNLLHSYENEKKPYRYLLEVKYSQSAFGVHFTEYTREKKNLT